MTRRRIAIAVQATCLALMTCSAGPAAVFAAATPAAAFQRQTAAAHTPTLLAQGLLMRRMRRRRERKMREVEQELEKNPNLVDDPNYLAQHPKLAEYLKRHPEAKSKIKSDPKGFFQHLRNERASRMNG